MESIIFKEIFEALKNEKENSEIQTYGSKMKPWGEFLEQKKKENKHDEFKAEISLFGELVRIRKEKMNKDFKDYEHPEDGIALTEDQKKEIEMTRKEYRRRLTLLQIKRCSEEKKNKPNISLRKLADKYYNFEKAPDHIILSKDTVSKWLMKAESNSEIKNLELVRFDHDNPIIKELDAKMRKHDRWEAKSLGVRDEDFEAWNNIGFPYDDS